MQKTVSVDYGSHKIVEPWLQTAYYCLLCGERQVWICDNGGDYYQGEMHLCTGCGAGFNLPNSPFVNQDSQTKQRLAVLRKEP